MAKDRARRLVIDADIARSASVRDIQRIVWVNPTKNDETPIKWLREGAKSEGYRQLGAS